MKSVSLNAIIKNLSDKATLKGSYLSFSLAISIFIASIISNFSTNSDFSYAIYFIFLGLGGILSTFLVYIDPIHAIYIHRLKKKDKSLLLPSYGNVSLDNASKNIYIVNEVKSHLSKWIFIPSVSMIIASICITITNLFLKDQVPFLISVIFTIILISLTAVGIIFLILKINKDKPKILNKLKMSYFYMLLTQENPRPREGREETNIPEFIAFAEKGLWDFARIHLKHIIDHFVKPFLDYEVVIADDLKVIDATCDLLMDFFLLIMNKIEKKDETEGFDALAFINQFENKNRVISLKPDNYVSVLNYLYLLFSGYIEGLERMYGDGLSGNKDNAKQLFFKKKNFYGFIRRISETTMKNGEKHCGYWRWDGWMRYLFLGLNVEEQLELEKVSKIIQALNAIMNGGYGIGVQSSLQQIVKKIEVKLQRFLDNSFLKTDHDDNEAREFCNSLFNEDIRDFLLSELNYGSHSIGSLLLDLRVKRGLYMYRASFEKLKKVYNVLIRDLFTS